MKFKIEDLAWQKHMRKVDLARATGLRWGTISKYWVGADVKRPDLEVLTKIATALGVSVTDLIVRDEENVTA